MQNWDRVNNIALTDLQSSFSSILKRRRSDVQHHWQSRLCKTTENLLEIPPTPPKKTAKKIPPKNPNSEIQLEILTR